MPEYGVPEVPSEEIETARLTEALRDAGRDSLADDLESLDSVHLEVNVAPLNESWADTIEYTYRIRQSRGFRFNRLDDFVAALRECVIGEELIRTIFKSKFGTALVVLRKADGRFVGAIEPVAPAESHARGVNR